jgi:hypothetical protein
MLLSILVFKLFDVTIFPDTFIGGSTFGRFIVGFVSAEQSVTFTYG